VSQTASQERVDAFPFHVADPYVTEAIVGDDDAIAAAVAEAEIPALLAALALVTGDLTILREDLRPPQNPIGATIEPQGGMSAAAQALARSIAVRKLIEFRDRGSTVTHASTPDALNTIMRFLTNNAADEYIPLLRHELGLPEDMGKPRWHKDEVAPETDFKVVIVGAGISGLAAAHRFRQAGVSFIVLEKNPEVGGTWWENTYPGCRLDTPNYAYSFSFAQKPDWPQQFSRQPVIRDYLIGVSQDFSLRDQVRFSTEVVSAEFNDVSALWTVTTRQEDGTVNRFSANAVVTAVGQLNRPSYPAIKGRESFAGQSFHSSDWDHSVDLADKRVAVIGTGASAYQIVPSIVSTTGVLKVFQRNAPWLLPTATYHHDIRPGLHWLFRHLPFYARWYRFWQFWIAAEGRLPFVKVDPEWNKPGSVSAPNEQLRQDLLRYLETQFSDRPDLLEKTTPNYPPGAKRLLRDNGSWASALKQPHVSLITETIAEITPDGIRTQDGIEHLFDVIVYATGFTASDFLTPMIIKGNGGIDLQEQWDGDARAYLGVTIPNFPNLFVIYGPTSGVVVNGSVVFISECGAEYILECFHQILESGIRTLEIKPEPFEDYNRKVDAENKLRAWGTEGVSTWYQNKHGRVSQNWPFSLLEYWNLTRAPEMHHFKST
jgi:4-hydroxyacetophenone monooxygenase